MTSPARHLWGNKMRKPALLSLAVALSAMIPVTGSAQVNTGAPLPAVMLPPSGVAPTDLPRSYPDAELDRIVSPIALYPDPLLAQVLSAAAFPQQIPQANRFVEERRGMTGPQLADALAAERVSWDPSVQALVAFPTVLKMMASAIPWTAEIGDAFQTQHGDVMDAVQRKRGEAQRYGYLQSTEHYRVSNAPVIEILPVNPEYVVVPYYDPVIVFYPPRPYYRVSSAIYLGFGVRLGVWYDPWGWRSTGFYWTSHRVVAGYPGWDRPRGYRPPPPIYHYPPVVYGNRNDRDRDDRDREDRSRGVATPRGYQQTNGNGRNNRDTNISDRRFGTTDNSRPTPTPVVTPRSAQPRQVEAQPQPRAAESQPQPQQPRQVREVQRELPQREAPREQPKQESPSGGERTAKARIRG